MSKLKFSPQREYGRITSFVGVYADGSLFPQLQRVALLVRQEGLGARMTPAILHVDSIIGDDLEGDGSIDFPFESVARAEMLNPRAEIFYDGVWTAPAPLPEPVRVHSRRWHTITAAALAFCVGTMVHSPAAAIVCCLAVVVGAVIAASSEPR